MGTTYVAFKYTVKSVLLGGLVGWTIAAHNLNHHVLDSVMAKPDITEILHTNNQDFQRLEVINS